MGDLVNAGLDLIGIGPASKQADATRGAAEQSAAASRYATDLQKQMFDEQIRLQEPYRQAGLTSQNRLMELMGLGGNAGAAGYGKYAKDFGMQDFQQDPGYAFRLSEGLKGLDRSAAARGGLISGGALKAATQYGQEMGSQEYQNAFNRYQTNRTNQLQPLQSLTGISQTASNTLGQAAGQYGTNASNLAMTNAANQGNAMLSQGNISASQYGTMGSALNQALNTNWSKVGNAFGNPYTASQYGTNLGSQQTNMLAAQEAGMW